MKTGTSLLLFLMISFRYCTVGKILQININVPYMVCICKIQTNMCVKILEYSKQCTRHNVVPTQVPRRRSCCTARSIIVRVILRYKRKICFCAKILELDFAQPLASWNPCNKIGESSYQCVWIYPSVRGYYDRMCCGIPLRTCYHPWHVCESQVLYVCGSVAAVVVSRPSPGTAPHTVPCRMLRVWAHSPKLTAARTHTHTASVEYASVAYAFSRSRTHCTAAGRPLGLYCGEVSEQVRSLISEWNIEVR